jgi:hypothetical protein
LLPKQVYSAHADNPDLCQKWPLDDVRMNTTTSGEKKVQNLLFLFIYFFHLLAWLGRLGFYLFI